MERNFLNRFPPHSLFALALLLAAFAGCAREEGKATKTAPAGANATVATNVPPEAPSAPLTEEEKEAERMRDLLDDGNTQAAIRLARNLMDSTNKGVRSQVLETLAWIGHRALPEITEMINDDNPSIAEEALSSWEQAFSEISGEHRQAAIIADTLPKLKRPDPVNAILMHATELDEHVALPMLSKIIDANANFIGECAREMYAHITGGEIYESAEVTRRYLEESKKAESKSKPAKQEVDHEAQK